MALITMDDNGGLPIKCATTRASSRVTHGSLRFRKYACAARSVSANKPRRVAVKVQNRVNRPGVIRQEGGGDDDKPRFALVINNEKMRDSPSLRCIERVE